MIVNHTKKSIKQNRHLISVDELLILAKTAKKEYKNKRTIKASSLNHLMNDPVAETTGYPKVIYTLKTWRFSNFPFQGTLWQRPQGNLTVL